jgi:hypothetical protein
MVIITSRGPFVIRWVNAVAEKMVASQHTSPEKKKTAFYRKTPWENNALFGSLEIHSLRVHECIMNIIQTHDMLCIHTHI